LASKTGNLVILIIIIIMKTATAAATSGGRVVECTNGAVGYITAILVWNPFFCRLTRVTNLTLEIA
jgi:hypothetical protein